MALEVGEPEYTSFHRLEMLHNLVADVVVNNIFEINLVKVVGPWVQDREALVLDALRAILLNILLDEIKFRLVGTDRVSQIVLVDDLARIAHKRVDSLDAA